MTSATDPREDWARACERFERLAATNPFFGPMADVVRTLADGACANVALARVDGVDLHLSRAVPVDAVPFERAVASPLEVRLRALTDAAIEIRCVVLDGRARPRVRIADVSQAACEIEQCLWELGWIAEEEW